jgi:hypothetical protein
MRVHSVDEQLYGHHTHLVKSVIVATPRTVAEWAWAAKRWSW